MNSDIEGRFPFAITKARLERVLRGWASVNAETDLAVGSTIVSTTPHGCAHLVDEGGWTVLHEDRVPRCQIVVADDFAPAGKCHGLPPGSTCGSNERLGCVVETPDHLGHGHQRAIAPQIGR